jgi:hypothetical protein
MTHGISIYSGAAAQAPRIASGASIYRPTLSYLNSVSRVQIVRCAHSGWDRFACRVGIQKDGTRWHDPVSGTRAAIAGRSGLQTSFAARKVNLPAGEF